MKRGDKNGVIVIAPPWARGGSTNTFSAEVMTHALADRRVLLHLGPTDLWHLATQKTFWDDTVEALRFPGLENITYSRASDDMRRWRSKSFYQWLLAGCDDSIAISARYAANAAFPEDLINFIRQHPIELVHVNHAFEMSLGKRVAKMAHAIHGRRPLILCDTHDIQSSTLFFVKRANQFNNTVDAQKRLLASEIALYADADILTHCSQGDLEFFSEKLPEKRHELLLPSLFADTEKRLRSQRDSPTQPLYDFVYFGNNHEANQASVLWLLNEVLPLVADKSCRIAIVGRVSELIRDHNPDVYRANEAYFVGEVQDICFYYRNTRAVLAQAVAGSGTSIKLIEAMCAGKPTLTTTHSLRGLPKELRDCNALVGYDTPKEFAAAMTANLDGAGQNSKRMADVYDRFFSNASFRKRLNQILGRADAAGQP